MANEVTVPAVSVNGKPVDTSSIDNYDDFMLSLIQSSHLARIRKYVEDLTPIGEVQNWDIAVTPDVQLFHCSHVSQSIYAVNDGPGDIYIVENLPNRTPTRLRMRDEMRNDYRAHRILRFYIWSAPGTVSAARVKVKA